jgi:hypothetical protein
MDNEKRGYVQEGYTPAPDGRATALPTTKASSTPRPPSPDLAERLAQKSQEASQAVKKS